MIFCLATVLTFFRKIRQNLLLEGKTVKYFKYVFGEIILVVIGILIALQINNWNNERLLIEKEKKYLIEIERDLKTNVEIFESLKNLQIIQIEKIDFLLNYIKERLPYTIDFSTEFRSIKGIEEIEIISTGFNTVSSYGLDIIRTDSLRSEMVFLFGDKYPND